MWIIFCWLIFLSGLSHFCKLKHQFREVKICIYWIWDYFYGIKKRLNVNISFKNHTIID